MFPLAEACNGNARAQRKEERVRSWFSPRKGQEQVLLLAHAFRQPALSAEPLRSKGS